MPFLRLATALFFVSISLSSNTFAAPQCLDASTDPDGDGWGYENGQSCTVAPNAVASTIQTDTCIDPDGDGWGWDGASSCRIQNTVQQSGPCIDEDGDGWGWNGIESCRIDTPASIDPVISPPNVDNSVVDTPVVIPTADPTPTNTPVTVQSAGNATDCTVVLSAGDNIYTAVASSARKICLRPGAYFLPQQLSMKSNQTLAGLTPSDPPRLNTSAVRSIVTTGQTNVVLENFVLDGNNSGATEFAILVGNGSVNTRLENVVIQNTVGIGLGITNSRTINVINSTIRNIGLDTRLRQAVWAAFGSSDIYIDGLTVRGRENDQAGGDHAVTCIDGDGWTVTNSRSDFAGSGALASNNCHNVVFTNNQLHNGREHGIDIVNGAVGALIRNNTITGFARAPMVFDDHDWKCGGCGTNPTEIIVDNNTMRNNNLTNLAFCKGIAVDSQMQINPANPNRAWVVINANNTVDSGSALHCAHIH